MWYFRFLSLCEKIDIITRWFENLFFDFGSFVNHRFSKSKIKHTLNLLLFAEMLIAAFLVFIKRDIIFVLDSIFSCTPSGGVYGIFALFYDGIEINSQNSFLWLLSGLQYLVLSLSTRLERDCGFKAMSAFLRNIFHTILFGIALSKLGAFIYRFIRITIPYWMISSQKIALVALAFISLLLLLPFLLGIILITYKVFLEDGKAFVYAGFFFEILLAVSNLAIRYNISWILFINKIVAWILDMLLVAVYSVAHIFTPHEVALDAALKTGAFVILMILVFISFIKNIITKVFEPDDNEENSVSYLISLSEMFDSGVEMSGLPALGQMFQILIFELTPFWATVLFFLLMVLMTINDTL